MDWPPEIDYHLGLHLDYNNLVKLFIVGRRFYDLGRNPLFWQWKAQFDFNISADEFSSITKELALNPLKKIAEHEAYIRVAGEQGYAIPGAELYGNIYKLLLNATQRRYYDYLLAHMLNRGPRRNILRELGRQGNKDLIEKLVHQFSFLDIYLLESAIEGAIEVNNWDLADKFLSGVSFNFTYILNYPAKRENYPMIDKYINKLHSVWYVVLSAAQAGDLKMIEYIASKRSIDYDCILEGAASGEHYQLIDYAIAKGATDSEAAIEAAVKGGHLKMVDYLITKFRIPHYTSILEEAARYGRLHIVKALLDRGGSPDLNSVVDQSCDEKITQFLIDNGAKPSGTAVDSAIIDDNLQLVKCLVTIVPADDVTYRKWIHTAMFYDNLKIVKFLLFRRTMDLNQLQPSEYPDIRHFMSLIK